MRVRITRARHGEIDGVVLDAFQVGGIYELPSGLATYLVITKSAELVADEGHPSLLPFETRFEVMPAVPAIAADRGRRRKHKPPEDVS